MTIEEQNNTDRIVEQLSRGNKKAQYELYKNYVGMVYHTAYRMIANQNDAEDIAQETFVKVFGSVKSFKKQSTIGWWIKRIAVTTTLSKIEKRKRLNWTLVENDLQFEKSVELDEVETAPKVSMKDIQASILQLPDRCRMVFNLYAVEGYTHQEIADILKINENTSKTQYRRARLLLQPLLKKKINA